MLFVQGLYKINNERMKEKIKLDLLSSLRKKGIDINRIQIDMSPNNMNLELCIVEKNQIRFGKCD